VTLDIINQQLLLIVLRVRSPTSVLRETSLSKRLLLRRLVKTKKSMSWLNSFSWAILLQTTTRRNTLKIALFYSIWCRLKSENLKRQTFDKLLRNRTSTLWSKSIRCSSLLRRVNLKKRREMPSISFLIRQDFEISSNVFVVISRILEISWLRLWLNAIVLRSEND
jgi:hypothetical protein